jgi:hypothetical protein
MTAIENKIFAALAQPEPSPMAVRQLYRRAWTASPKTYSRIDFSAIDIAIMQKFDKEQFRAIRHFAVSSR